jgi:Pal1 cell morphology protein
MERVKTTRRAQGSPPPALMEPIGHPIPDPIENQMTLLPHFVPPPPIDDETPIVLPPGTKSAIDNGTVVNVRPLRTGLHRSASPLVLGVTPSRRFPRRRQATGRVISRMDISTSRGVRDKRMTRRMTRRMVKVRVLNDDCIQLIKSIYLMLRDSMGPDVLPPQNLQTILLSVIDADALIVFHHDGPFDACRPHRNKHSHKAPVAAFPTDSVTNTLAGGLGEVPGLDRQQYFGLAPREAFEDYGHVGANKHKKGLAPIRRTSDPEPTAVPRTADDDYKLRPSPGVRSTSFDTRLKTEMVHGVESAGLGTSTFLEGAPAPKSAIEKAAAEEAEDGSVLVRKKSLVQKIKVRRATAGDRSLPPPPTLSGPLLAGANGDRGGGGLEGVYNPVFKEGQFIERVESLPTPSSASRERADSGGSDKGNPGGLLGRVKSLKISGGRKVSSK